jgi:hypothetical protein
MILPGTTPTHTFEIDDLPSNITNVRITYKQKNKIIIQKEKEDCEIQPGTISVTLTQEDTLKFTNNEFVKIQLRAVTDTGEALSHDPIIKTVGECLDNEVL